MSLGIRLFGEKNENMLRDTEIACAYYGTNGDRSYAEVGAGYNLSRQRVEQIVSSFKDKKASISSSLNHLETFNRLNKALSDHVQASIKQIQEDLVDLLGEDQGIEGAMRFAKDFLDQEWDYVVGRQDGDGRGAIVLMEKSGTLKAKVVKRLLFEMQRLCGACQTQAVIGAVKTAWGANVSANDVINIAKTDESFQWLNEDIGWFWFESVWSTRSQMYRAVQKVLSIAEVEVSAEDLYVSVLRAIRNRKPSSSKVMVLPPLQVFEQMLVNTFWIEKVNGCYILDGEPRSLDRVLSPIELRIHEELMNYGGLASRDQLRLAVMDERASTLVLFNKAVQESPVLREILPDVYGVLGKNYGLDEIQAAIASAA